MTLCAQVLRLAESQRTLASVATYLGTAAPPARRVLASLLRLVLGTCEVSSTISVLYYYAKRTWSCFSAYLANNHRAGARGLSYALYLDATDVAGLPLYATSRHAPPPRLMHRWG